jgi:hypothetical protein
MATCSHLDAIEVVDLPDRATGHPIVRSAEPGEDWSWCYADELMFRIRSS